MNELLGKQIVVLILVCGCPLAVSGEEQDLNRTEFEGFSCVVPVEWKKVAPDREKTKAYLLHYGKSFFFADGMLMVDVGKPVDEDPVKIARMLAGKDGKVDPKPIQIDGVAGYRVQTTSNDFSRPHLGIVIMRGGKMYLIMAARKNGFDTSKALETVVESWRWAK